MTELIQVRKKAQVTLPQSIRKELNIEEGDLLDVKVRDGEIVLKVQRLIDKDQAWFWTKRWQEGEREADEDIKAGRVHHFDDVEKGIGFLHEQAAKYDKTKKGVKK
jgi:AbrB family looped-hinge helix DNA binding protein